MRDNDVIALICAQNADPEHDGLSETCHHVLWSFKLALTQGDNFIQRIKKVQLLKINSEFDCDIYHIPCVSFSEL